MPSWLHELLRYDPETGHLFWKAIGKRAGTAATETRRYRRVQIGGVEYLEHVVIWAMQTGAWPTFEIDHRDHDGSNNRWTNLRELSRGDNQRETRFYQNNTSGYRGVSWDKRRSMWAASIRIDGKKQWLGYFDDPAMASAAYQAARPVID